MKDAFGVEISKAMTRNKERALGRARSRRYVLASPSSRRANNYALDMLNVHHASQDFGQANHAGSVASAAKTRAYAKGKVAAKPALALLLKPRVLP